MVLVFLIRVGFIRFIAQYMEQLPIPPATDAQKTAIAPLVKKILSDPDSPHVPALEAEINRLVYEFYGLNPEETAIIEGDLHV